MARWLITLPDNLWENALGSVLNSWSDADSTSRDTWFNQLPADKRDKALADYCRAAGSYRSHRQSPSRTLIAFFQTLININAPLARELIVGLKKEERWVALGAIRDAAPPRGMQAVIEVLLSFDRSDTSTCSSDLVADSLDERAPNDPLAVKQFLDTHHELNPGSYSCTFIRRWAAYDARIRAAMDERTDCESAAASSSEADENESFEQDNWRSSVDAMDNRVGVRIPRERSWAGTVVCSGTRQRIQRRRGSSFVRRRSLRCHQSRRGISCFA